KNVLLRDIDAMSMAHSLEIRVPFLDHVLVEWALRLPAKAKTGGQKALLVAAVKDMLPREVLMRRKQAFHLPIAEWMREPLRSEIEERIRKPPEELAGILESGGAACIWKEYLDGGTRWVKPWALYALLRWTESLRELSQATT